MAVSTTTPNIELLDPDAFADGPPHEAFDWLRREAPVYAHPHPDLGHFWVVTRGEDVAAISKDPQTFSSHEKGVFIEEDTVLPLEFIQQSLLLMDPPDHTRLRRVVARRFTPKRVAKLEPRVREVANATVDEVIERGECNFAVDIAAQIPLRIICELMGIPEEDHQRVFHWANTISAFDDPSYRGDPEDGLIAFEECYLYAYEMAEARAEDPRDDLFTTLVQQDAEGESLSELEVATFFMLLAVAGNETTRNTSSHGMKALIEHPDQRRALMDDPSLIPNAVEEILRYASVVNYFRRTPTRDVELRGQPVKAGDAVVVYYASANRDEEFFDDPHQFDIRRDFKEHFAFGGGGPHFCLGAPLARMELRVIFETLLERMPDAEISGPITRIRSNWMNGIEEMPVTFTPGARTVT